MSFESVTQPQCRTLDATYLFHFDDHEDVTLKVLDVCQKNLFTKTYSAENLRRWKITLALIEKNTQLALERLVEENQIPGSFCPSFTTEVTNESCQSVLQQVISQLKPKASIGEKRVESFTCPLTLEIFENPVIDKCGHTFEEAAIKESMKRKNECPLSRAPIRDFTPNRVVSSMIAELRERPPIPTFALFKKENPGLAKCNHQLAQACVKEGEYEDALEAYAKAFTYTKEWGYFVTLPSLFETMGEWKKATYAYLLLAQYQLEADLPDKAIQTLEACQKGKGFSLQINLVLIELYCLIDELDKGLELAYRTAGELSKEKPEQAFKMHRRIEFLQKSMRKKGAVMCGAGAAVGGGLSAVRVTKKTKTVKKTKISSYALNLAFGKAAWKKYFGDVGKEPPLPKNITEILKRRCPYFPGKKVGESHLLVLIPQTVDGEPFTLNKLGEMIRRPLSGHMTKYGYYSPEIKNDLGDKEVGSSYWILMTKDVIPNSPHKNFIEKQALLQRDYTVPEPLEAVTGILMNHVQTKERLYDSTSFHCQQGWGDNGLMEVGVFEGSGFKIYGYSRSHAYSSTGLAGLRKF